MGNSQKISLIISNLFFSCLFIYLGINRIYFFIFFQILGSDTSPLHPFQNMPYHWNNDLFNLGHCHHRVLGTTFWMEGSQFWTSSQWRKNMYSQPGFGLPDFCHHVHILHPSGDYFATLLEDFYDSQNEVKKKDGCKGTSRLFIEWCRYVKYKCLHQLNNKKSFLKHIFK